MRTEIINGMAVHMPDKKYVVSNLSKEQILFNAAGEEEGICFELKPLEILSIQTYEAMEEYAKQQSLLFTTFRENYQREERRRVKKEEERLGGIISWIGTPDDKIYDLFLQDQSDARGGIK